MNIAIMGTGYVGLVTGVCLAVHGHRVICVDKNEDIVEKINDSVPPIYEPGISELLKKAIDAGNLKATTDLKHAIQHSDVSMICVGTPFKEGKIDLSQIVEISQEIGRVLKTMKAYHVVCVKSTVVPTTTDKLVREILEQESGKKAGAFGLAMNPEFLREGNAIEDFIKPDRIVIGANDERSYKMIKKLYSHFKAPIIKVNLRTAEMIKYASNALFASLISFSNEIGNICEGVGNIDVTDVLNGVCLDKRINPKKGGKYIFPGIVSYIKAGCGFGGSCFPKDVKALSAFAEDLSCTSGLLKSVININEIQPIRLVQRMERELETLAGKRIAVLGLAFKPDTDDVRESPAIRLIEELISKNAEVIATDPKAVDMARKLLPPCDRLTLTTRYDTALRSADAAVLVTAWKEYIYILPEEFGELMKKPIIFDGRRIYNRAKMEQMGIKYIGIGYCDNDNE